MDFLSGATTDHLQLSSSTLTPLLNADNASEPIGGRNLSGVSKMITVNSTADTVDNSDGVTTLRQAINFANTDTTDDAIVFDSSVFATAQTISLSLGELNITHNLSILAPTDSSTGEDLLTISGNNATRVFEIGTAATVTLSGSIIANAKVSDGNGGGINNSGTLTLDNSVVRDNTLALNSTNNAYGGGIYNTGTLNLNNTTLTGNSLSHLPPPSSVYVPELNDFGGGIYNSGTLKVNNSTLSNNKADGSNSVEKGFGGAIYNTGTLEVSNSNLTSNMVGNTSRVGYGCGIYNTGTLEVINSTLTDNKISLGYGGGIYNTGSLNVSSSTLSSNQAGFGGGIYSTGTVKVSNSTLSENTSYFSSIGGFNGGGIYNAGILEVSNNTLNHNMSYRGNGSGIYNTTDGMVTISSSTLINNSGVSGFGGGICNDGKMQVSNTTLSGNKVSAALNDSNGGGIYNTGTLTVSDSTLTDNTVIVGAYSANGGGIYNGTTGILTLSNSTLSRNSVSKSNSNDILNSGGGIYNAGTLNINNSTVSENFAPNGGGIFNNGNVTVTNSTISSNFVMTAKFLGHYQRIGGNGGGIFNSNLGTLTISNSTISNNSTTDSTVGNSSNLPEFILNGGGIFNSGLLTLLFTTVANNQATNGGGVFSNDAASTTLRDTIIASNFNSTGGNNPDVSGNFISLGYNLIGDATGSTGFNATGDIVGTSDNPIDPRLDALLFNGGSTATLALLPDSPAIDAGDPSLLATDPTTDQRGQPRVSGIRPDIGAFEFSQ